MANAIAAHHDDVDARLRRTRSWCRPPTRFPAPGPGRGARAAGDLRQAAGEAGGDRRLVRRRGEGLRHPGRPRDPRHGRADKVATTGPRWLAKDMAAKIEDELEYPGQIKVTVIRETRAVEYRPVISGSSSSATSSAARAAGPCRSLPARAAPEATGHRFVIANGENAAGGRGITEDIGEDLFVARRRPDLRQPHLGQEGRRCPISTREPRLLRPANYPPGAPGALVLRLPGGRRDRRPS